MPGIAGCSVNPSWMIEPGSSACRMTSVPMDFHMQSPINISTLGHRYSVVTTAALAKLAVSVPRMNNPPV